MIVRRIGPLSLAKISGTLYALMGLLVGAIVSVISMVGGAMAPGDERSGMIGALFGAAAIIVLPVCYGVLGFVGSLIGAVIYNAIAGVVGGVEIDVQ